jgi:hypothetical protein
MQLAGGLTGGGIMHSDAFMDDDEEQPWGNR